MQGNRVTYNFFIPGTLAAAPNIRFALPFDATLTEVSSSCSGAGTVGVKVGNSVDDDAYLTAAASGASGVPVRKTKADFVGGACPHIAKGTIVTIAGALTSSPANFSVVLTFLE